MTTQNIAADARRAQESARFEKQEKEQDDEVKRYATTDRVLDKAEQWALKPADKKKEAIFSLFLSLSKYDRALMKRALGRIDALNL